MEKVVILNISFADKPVYDKPPFMPIMAGGSKSQDVITDDTGDNISYKNKRFGELTAIYWAWKNLKNVDIIGVSHYRRFLIPRKLTYGKLYYELSRNQFLDINYDITILINQLRHFDWITTRYMEWPISNLEFYKISHDDWSVGVAREVFNEMCPEMLPYFDRYWNGRATHMYGQWITTWENFDHFCGWLFPILFRVC